MVRDANGGPILPTISGQGASWTTLVDSGALHNVRTVIFFGTVTSPGTTVTVSWTGGVAPRVSASAQEWSNLTNGMDGTNSTDVVSNAASVVVSTTNTYDLILAVGGHNLSETVFNPGIPWKVLNATSGMVPTENPVYQIVSSALSFNPTWTWATSTDGAAAIVALKAVRLEIDADTYPHSDAGSESLSNAHR